MSDREATWRRIAAGLLAEPIEETAVTELRARIGEIARSVRIPSEIDLDDVVQATLLRLLDGRALAAALHGDAIVRMTLRWVIVDSIREDRREREARKSLARDRIAEPAHDDLVEANEDRVMSARRIESLLGTLTSEERRLLELRFWEESSIQEIATLLGISYTAAAVRIFRLLKRLRDRGT